MQRGRGGVRACSAAVMMSFVGYCFSLESFDSCFVLCFVLFWFVRFGMIFCHPGVGGPPMSGVTLVWVVVFGDVVLAGFGEGLCVLLLLSFGFCDGNQEGFGEGYSMWKFVVLSHIR